MAGIDENEGLPDMDPEEETIEEEEEETDDLEEEGPNPEPAPATAPKPEVKLTVAPIKVAVAPVPETLKLTRPEKCTGRMETVLCELDKFLGNKKKKKLALAGGKLLNDLTNKHHDKTTFRVAQYLSGKNPVADAAIMEVEGIHEAEEGVDFVEVVTFVWETAQKILKTTGSILLIFG